ncbi:putative membrane-associated kinase regulator 4 [Carex littledalei]|uniref:Putative membrane-associated kinase regulator 4 n=1 Tax=Carex littledalei TaxID=544730 RepID=A0A833R586_9POAL|nr:putative membrane-associated kinase regulator 4 [Carex littledalei]
MAKTLSASPLITIKEDYIDMDLSPKMSSPSEDLYGGDFEFKMSLNNDLERESNTFPADELFYKGNLLPLQLPPRLQLFQKLLHNHEPLSNFSSKDTSIECPDEKPVIKSMPRKHWPKRLKFFKQTHLTSKFKASKGYLKSLFTKTNNSIQEENDQFGALKSTIAIDREKFLEEGTGTTHRKSFSGVIRRRLTGKSSQVSGSSMCSSSDLNRWFEEESSIQGAIAYCKKTQENLVPSRKSVSDVIFPSFALPRVSVGCENQEREEISRG